MVSVQGVFERANQFLLLDPFIVTKAEEKQAFKTETAKVSAEIKRKEMFQRNIFIVALAAIAVAGTVTLLKR